VFMQRCTLCYASQDFIDDGRLWIAAAWLRLFWIY
jgi:hypothetical protein